MTQSKKRTVFSIRRTHSLDAQANGKLREGRDIEVALNYDALRTGWLARFASHRQGKGALAVLLAIALHCRSLAGADFEQLQELGLVADDDEGRLFCRVTDVGLADELGTSRKAVARAVDWLNEEQIIHVLEIPTSARDKEGFYRDSKGRFKGDAIYLLAANGVLTTISTDGEGSVGHHNPPLTFTVGRNNPPPVSTVSHHDPPPTSTVGHHDPRPDASEPLERAPTDPPVGHHDPYRGSSRRTNACLLGNKEEKHARVPSRKSGPYDQQTLKTNFPIQPDGLAHDQAFNLALDKALALLPPKLKNTDATLYTLAAEVHSIARASPSSAWPDAGGAGWVLDSVQEAIATGPVSSAKLIRAIINRWIAEGNPYSASVRLEKDSSLTTIVETSRKADNLLQTPDSNDSILAQVTDWYLQELGARITPMVTDDLRDLTQIQRDLNVWEYAFRVSRHIDSTMARWRYISAVVRNPDTETIRAWLDSGKKQIDRRKGDSDGTRQHNGRATTRRKRQGRRRSVGQWTPEEIQEIQRQAAAELGEVWDDGVLEQGTGADRKNGGAE